MFTNGFDHFNPGKDFNAWMDLDDNAFFNVLREELFGVLNIPVTGAPSKSRSHWESVIASVSDAGAARGAKVGARNGVLSLSYTCCTSSTFMRGTGPASLCCATAPMRRAISSDSSEPRSVMRSGCGRSRSPWYTTSCCTAPHEAQSQRD